MDLVTAHRRRILQRLAVHVCAPAVLACQALVDPSISEVKRCPKPCPAACAQACLPTGYCESATRTIAAMALAPIPVGKSWTLAVSGFPPGTDVDYVIHAGFDLIERAGRSPLNAFVAINGDSVPEFRFGGVHDSFPLWSEYESHQRSDADGTLRLPLELLNCEFADEIKIYPANCFIDDSSTLTATLVSNSAWSEAPPCD
jgi:hypothetical protein